MYHVNKLQKRVANNLERTKNLLAHCNLPFVKNDKSVLAKILGLEKTDHWRYIEYQVENFLEEKDFYSALQMVNVALNHLETKTVWKLADGAPAFSNLAVVSEVGSKVPVVGKFFTDVLRNAHYQGRDKMEERLDKIDAWLTTLEEQLDPNVVQQVFHYLQR